jgi:hypothetical protein
MLNVFGDKLFEKHHSLRIPVRFPFRHVSHKGLSETAGFEPARACTRRINYVVPSGIRQIIEK